jgi:hypothetical protein
MGFLVNAIGCWFSDNSVSIAVTKALQELAFLPCTISLPLSRVLELRAVGSDGLSSDTCSLISSVTVGNLVNLAKLQLAHR